MRTPTLLTIVLSLTTNVIAQAAKGRDDHLFAQQEPVLAAQPTTTAAAGSLFEGHDGKTSTDGGAGEGTTFNNKIVPPIIELKSDNIDDTIKQGYWFVEYFSPWCGHCKHFAPTWQTLYEFYYTIDPPNQAAASMDMNTFTKYYDFHFAKLDCNAYGDACANKDVKSFPSIRLYKDGQLVTAKDGAKKLKDMSAWIEEELEKIKPGTRPVGGPKLPAVGARSVEADEANAAAAAAAAKVAAGKSTLTATRLTKPTATEVPNQLGKSIQLTAESFQHLVTTTEHPWFIKFYAPWCHHCQDMAPNWKEMARQKKGQLNVAEVNCDEEKRLCKEVKVKGFPTILFFRGGERIEYQGLRGLGDLINFGTQAVALAEGVREVNATEFEALELEEEVIFLYTYDQATTSEDFTALERLVMSLIGHAKLVKSSDPILAQRFKISTWPRLLVSRDGKTTYYDGLSPRDMRDYRRVLDWMQTVWLPIVPELTASNAKDIMENKLVVLGILSRDRAEDFEVAKREMKNAALEWIDKREQAFYLDLRELRYAKQLRIDEAEDRNDQRALRAAKSIRINMEDIDRKDVSFAWIDGVFWERWVRTTYGISVKDGDRVIINDQPNRRYWDNTITGNPIVPSRTSILETLPKIVANPPKISPKTTHTTMGHLLWTIKRGFIHHPILNAGVVIGMLIATAIWVRNRLRGRDGRLRLDDKSNPMGGLLNGSFQSQGGKVD